MNDALARYRTLLARVDELFAKIQAAHAGEMQCRAGCHSCCKPGVTVNGLEAAAIRQGLAEPERRARLLALEAENPHGGKRCPFLDSTGTCGIYELRPLVCRSHGAPLQFKDPDGEQAFRDVCPLNFTSLNIGELPATDVMNLDTLNTLLSLLNRMGFGNERVELRPSALLN